jgi:primosomal protein N' (replication factor Y)
VEFARQHDFTAFFNEEMRIRREALLPPYSVFFRLVFTGKDEEKVREACLNFAEGLEAEFADIRKDILLLDASEAPISRIQGRARWHILIKVLNDEPACAVPQKIIYLYGYKKLQRLRGSVWRSIRRA